jgi:hypothetical protein
VKSRFGVSRPGFWQASRDRRPSRTDPPGPGARRTDAGGETNTGIAVIEAPDRASAEAIMNADPAIARGVVRGELREMRVSLLRGRD